MSRLFPGLTACLLTLSLALPLRAGEAIPITGDAITALLAGNTAIGVWNGDDYRQYFDPSGTTYYAPKGQRSTRGKWRVSEDGQAYESWWNGAEDNWETWWLAREDDRLVWIGHEGQTYPFEIVAGQQLVWPED